MVSSPALCFNLLPKMLCCYAEMSTNQELLFTLGPCCNKESKNGLFLEYLMERAVYKLPMSLQLFFLFLVF